jgi:hypothetical protein
MEGGRERRRRHGRGSKKAQDVDEGTVHRPDRQAGLQRVLSKPSSAILFAPPRFPSFPLHVFVTSFFVNVRLTIHSLLHSSIPSSTPPLSLSFPSSSSPASTSHPQTSISPRHGHSSGCEVQGGPGEDRAAAGQHGAIRRSDGDDEPASTEHGRRRWIEAGSSPFPHKHSRS